MMLRNYDDILFWCKNQNFNVKEKNISYGKQIVATKQDIVEIIRFSITR